MMKKETLSTALVFLFTAYTVLSMESSQKPKTVKMFHCTRQVLARRILQDGLKSRSQLVREGKAQPNMCELFSLLSDHDDSIYFQYIDEHDLENVEPGLYNVKAFNRRDLYCIAMEFDLDNTMIYNPHLRFWSPENNCGYKTLACDPIHASLSVAEKEKIYKKSGMTLKQYIAKQEYFERGNHNCPGLQEAIQDSFTAEVRCVSKDVAAKYTAYNWNEHTIKKDRIDPCEFVQ